MFRSIFFVLLFFVFLIGACLFYLSQTYPETPIKLSATYFVDRLIHPHAKLDKQVIGFLPYWKVDGAADARLDVLTEINYFGLTIDEDGNFLQVTNNETDPGWREWDKQSMKNLITKTQIMGDKFTLTIISQQNNVMETILDDKTAQQTVITNILKQVKTRHLNGINIDFEYFGEADPKYKNAFTQFAKKLSNALHQQNPNVTLSLSIMPLAARSNDLFDFPKLVPFDRFIGMSYDYYGISSDIAGPVAPMHGFKEGKYFFDVTTTYADYLKYIPSKKLVMGVPYYGWDWAVVDGATINSRTFAQSDPRNYAAVLSYARMRENKNLKPTNCHWDAYALETWCWYTDPETGVDHQVWFEDNKSLGIKFDYLNKQGLSGTAIWILGYDKNYPDLWDIMQEKFSNTK